MIGMHGSTLCHLAMPCIIYENKLYRKCQRVADDAPYSFFFSLLPVRTSPVCPYQGKLYSSVSVSLYLSLAPSLVYRTVYNFRSAHIIVHSPDNQVNTHTHTSGWRCLPTHSWPRQALTRKSNPEA